MIKALLISLFFWVVVVPGAVGSFLILRFLLGSDPVLYFFLVFLAVCVGAIVTVFGPILFPLEVASEFHPSFDDPEITTHQEERNADPYKVEVRP